MGKNRGKKTQTELRDLSLRQIRSMDTRRVGEVRHVWGETLGARDVCVWRRVCGDVCVETCVETCVRDLREACERLVRDL